MLKLIIEYKQATKLFIEYLKSNKVDPNNFFSADIKYQIGYFIDFIEQQGLSVICDNSNYWIYYTKNDPKSIQ
jgi:hypothetical protein